jgi:hypothetical protein
VGRLFGENPAPQNDQVISRMVLNTCHHHITFKYWFPSSLYLSFYFLIAFLLLSWVDPFMRFYIHFPYYADKKNPIFNYFSITHSFIFQMDPKQKLTFVTL